MPSITFKLNGRETEASYEPGMHLLEVLREECGEKGQEAHRRFRNELRLMNRDYRSPTRARIASRVPLVWDRAQTTPPEENLPC